MKTSKFILQKSMQNFKTFSSVYWSNIISNALSVKCLFLKSYVKKILFLFVLLSFSAFKTLLFSQPNLPELYDDFIHVNSYKTEPASPVNSENASMNSTRLIIKEPARGEMKPLVDAEGNEYRTVKIGKQIWMAENLKTTLYSDGSKIHSDLNNNEWRNIREGAFSVHPPENIRDINSKEEVINDYGILYNWHAVSDSRGLCPVGWEVPSNEDWAQLTDNLILKYVDINPVNIGNFLKSCRQIRSPQGEECDTSNHPRWYPNPTNYGMDKFGFSALPGGYRFAYGNFANLGSLGGWWTSSEDSKSNAWVRFMRDNSGYINNLSYDKTSGFSVRCIRNEVVPDRVP